MFYPFLFFFLENCSIHSLYFYCYLSSFLFYYFFFSSWFKFLYSPSRYLYSHNWDAYFLSKFLRYSEGSSSGYSLSPCSFAPRSWFSSIFWLNQTPFLRLRIAPKAFLNLHALVPSLLVILPHFWKTLMEMTRPFLELIYFILLLALVLYTTSRL